MATSSSIRHAGSALDAGAEINSLMAWMPSRRKGHNGCATRGAGGQPGRASEAATNAQSNADMFANLTLVSADRLCGGCAHCDDHADPHDRKLQRMQLGTLKALGYPLRRIRGHYLSYAVWPSLIGSLLGVVAGHAHAQRDLGAAAGTRRVPPTSCIQPSRARRWAMVALTKQ